MRNPEVIELLKIEIGVYKSEVNTLTEKISALENAIEILQPKQPAAVVELTKKADTTKKVAEKKKLKLELKPTKPGQDKNKIKFGTFILSILSNKPHKAFLTKEITGIVKEAIKKGIVKYTSKKDLSSSISASLYSHIVSGKIERYKSDYGFEYQYKSNADADTNLSGDELMIDKILGYTKDEALPAAKIVQKLFYDVDYKDIAKNLNGSLNTCTRNCLDNLLKNKKIDQDQDGNYFQI